MTIENIIGFKLTQNIIQNRKKNTNSIRSFTLQTTINNCRHFLNGTLLANGVQTNCKFLIDQKAASCVDLQFIKRVGFELDVKKVLNCDIQFKVKINGRVKSLEIRNVKLNIVQSLPVQAVVGIDIIKFLGAIFFSNTKLTIGNKTVDIEPRVREQLSSVLTLNKEQPIRECEFLLDDFIVVSDEWGYGCSLVCLKPMLSFTRMTSQGCYSVRIDDESIPNLCKNYQTFYYALPNSDRDESSTELQGRTFMLAFPQVLEEVPKIIKGSIREFRQTSDEKEEVNNRLLSLQSKSQILSTDVIDNMIFGTCLSKRHLRRLINNFSDIFSVNVTDMGLYSSPVKIEVAKQNGSPSYSKPRVIPYALRNYVDKKLTNMIDKGLIELSEGSPYNSPIHLVKEKTPGEWALEVDYRHLNTQLVKSRWPIPSVKTLLHSMSGATVFSTLNLRSDFWQLALDKDSQEITAFSVRGRQYKWKVLPRGLSTGPVIFQKIMMRVLEGLVNKSVLVYIDDVVLHSKSAKDHIELLGEVFTRLRKAGIKINPNQSKIGQNRVTFLGYELGSFGFRPSRSKVEAIRKMSNPKDKKELKSFIEAVTFFTSSIPSLQFILGPLHEITGSKAKFVWGERQEEAFLEAKQLLSSCGSLCFPSDSPDNTLVLTTDSSDLGYGSLLTEVSKDGIEKPLGYFSGNFQETQIRWPIREKELFSFYQALEFFYPQLIGVTFIWRTDNQSISTLSDSSLRLKTSGAPNLRILGWFNFINQFSFVTQLWSGKSPQMALADCLSRLRSEDKNATALENDKEISKLNLLKLPYWTKAGIPSIDFAKAQEEDQDLMNQTGIWYRFRTRELQQGKTKSTKFERRNKNGLHEINCNDKWLIMIPKSLLAEILDFYHGPNHAPMKTVKQRLMDHLFIPGLQKYLTKYANSCPTCLSVYSRPKLTPESTKTTTPVHPWLWAAMDLCGPLTRTLENNVYILTYVDMFSNWVEIRPLKDKTAASVVEALDSIFVIRGQPHNILHDNGKEFINSTVQDYLQDLAIKSILITPYAPWSNGLCERMNRKLSQQLKLNKVDELRWDKALPSIQLSMNLSRLNDGTSPYLRLHGWVLYRPGYVQADYDEVKHKEHLLSEDEWVKSNIVRMKQACVDRFVTEEEKKAALLGKDDRSQNRKIVIGQKCLVHFPQLRQCSKLFSSWKGVYIVEDQLDKNSFVVADENQSKKKYIVHKNRLRLLEEGIPGVNPGEKPRNRRRTEDDSDKERLETIEENAYECPEFEQKIDEISDPIIQAEPDPMIEKLQEVQLDRSEPEWMDLEVARASRPRRKIRDRTDSKIREWTSKLK